jgi:hypothetical protein
MSRILPVLTIGSQIAVELSALHTGRPYLRRNVIFLLLRLSEPQGLVCPKALGKLKKCIQLIGFGTCDLPLVA